MCKWSLIFLVTLLDVISSYNPITLTTMTTLKEVRSETIHKFLASPANWPKIVASSHSVKPDSTKSFDLNNPLPEGGLVQEIFGLPPILPLSVTWKCIRSDMKSGYLEFCSPDGLRGIASNCRMVFEIEDSTSNGNACTNVKLDMSYEPQSVFGVLAPPILTVDNAFALKVLLPFVLSRE